MGFIYGLAVFLVIFEGIIIQCEGGSTISRESAPEQIKKVIKPIFPKNVMDTILSKTDFETILSVIRELGLPAEYDVMSGRLQESVIVIMPELNNPICGSYHLGKPYITIGNYKGLTTFFKKFGDQVKKIAIYLAKRIDPRREITERFIKKYAKNFEALSIMGFHCDRFWNEISDGGSSITFPEVKNFQLNGDIDRHKFKLNLIFPKLEYLTLIGKVADENCFANVKGLKELTLCTDSIEEQKLVGIFQRNNGLTVMRLTEPKTTQTMHSIAKHLTKLKALAVESPGEQFLLRAKNGTVSKLGSVIHFGISFNKMVEVFGTGDLHLSFDMPHLKKLTLHGHQADDRIIKFIQHFKELEILEFFLHDYGPVECIKKLKHIREFTTTFDEANFDSLKKMFQNFDKTFKLQTIKFLRFDESLFQMYKEEMKIINIHLENSMKPTWTLSRGEQIETGEECFMFERQPCKCGSCNK